VFLFFEIPAEEYLLRKTGWEKIAKIKKVPGKYCKEIMKF